MKRCFLNSAVSLLLCLILLLTAGGCKKQEKAKPESDELSGIVITSPEEIAYPFQDICNEFITTSGALIKDYNVMMNDSVQPIMVEWETEGDVDYEDYRVEYATKSDFSNAETISNWLKWVELNNLYKDTTYYVRVTALDENGKAVAGGKTTFKMTDKGPRVMSIPGLHNVRDIGGYVTPNGTTKQGLIFRGCEMNGQHGIEIAPEGEEYMSKVLGIKTDLDLRGLDEADNITKSPISSAKLQFVSIGAYSAAFDQKELYRQIFSMMSDKSNYPFYVHCWAGADRTGTVCFLVNALLGVDEETLIKDYEFTSYSKSGLRDSTDPQYGFSDFLSRLKTYSGADLTQKTENYMLAIGVTAEEIDSIRAIMLGKEK